MRKLTATCRKCGATYKVNLDPGRRFKCKHCGASIAVPEGEPSVGATKRLVRDKTTMRLEKPAAQRPRHVRRPRHSTSTGPLLAIAVVGLLVIVGAIVVIAVLRGEKERKKEPEPSSSAVVSKAESKAPESASEASTPSTESPGATGSEETSTTETPQPPGREIPEKPPRKEPPRLSPEIVRKKMEKWLGDILTGDGEARDAARTGFKSLGPGGVAFLLDELHKEAGRIQEKESFAQFRELSLALSEVTGHHVDAANAMAEDIERVLADWDEWWKKNKDSYGREPDEDDDEEEE